MHRRSSTTAGSSAAREIRRGGTVVLLLIATALGVQFWVSFCLPILRMLSYNDFGKFYYAARMFEQGTDMYAASPATNIPVATDDWRQFLDLNPPHFHLPLLPLAHLPIEYAFVVWLVLGVAALVATVVLIARELGLAWTWMGATWVAAIVATSSATSAVAITGQLTFFLMLPMTLAWRDARHGHWDRAALWLGLLMSVKPFLGVFWIYALATRRWRALGMMSLSAACAFGIGLLVFGIQAHVSWLHALGAVTWQWVPMNASLSGVISRTFAVSPLWPPLVNAPQLVRPLSLFASVVILGSTFWIVTRDDATDGQALDRVFFLLSLAAELASPLGWIYYLPLVTAPAVGLWRSSRSHRSLARDTMLLLSIPGLIVPNVAVALTTIGHAWAGVTFGSVYTWTVALLWLAAVVDWKFFGTGARWLGSPAQLSTAGRD